MSVGGMSGRYDCRIVSSFAEEIVSTPQNYSMICRVVRIGGCFIACVDGLQGLPEAIEAVFPQTQVQLCIVHKVRNSLRYVPWRERRAVAADLRAIYGATTLTAAEQALERFADRWATKYLASSPSWLADWDRLTVCFDYPPAIRRAIYTTNAIESLNYSLRKVLKGRSAFPNDESIIKVLYMGLQHVAKKWTQPIPEWKAALNLLGQIPRSLLRLFPRCYCRLHERLSA
jgi:putative transposase